MANQREPNSYAGTNSVLYVRCYGEPVLRKKAVKLEHITEEDKALLDEMAKMMYSLGGIGLAATQIGINKQLFVVDAGNNLLKLANPCIVKKQGSHTTEEGCLSLPEVIVNVKRAKKIILEALDIDGKKVVIEAQDLLARALQHEIDHLEGRLIIDYLPWFKRVRLRRKLWALKDKKYDK